MSSTIVWYQGDEKLHVDHKEIIFEISIFYLIFFFRILNNYGPDFSNFAGPGRNHGPHFSHLIHVKKTLGRGRILAIAEKSIYF